MSKPDGGPAFAQFTRISDANDVWDATGMTLRDYFAAHALGGHFRTPPESNEPGSIAADAYRIADAMLAERAK